MFLDTAIGYPGSMHGARILRASNIFTKAENGSVLKEPVISLNGVTVRPLLLEDRAYPINVIFNRSQRNYNKTLSSARSTVERAFGVLKAIWRILLKRLVNKFCNIPEVILTCCILHNFCQDAGEEFDDDEVLQRIIAVEREEMQANTQVQNRGIVQNPVQIKSPDNSPVHRTVFTINYLFDSCKLPVQFLIPHPVFFAPFPFSALVLLCVIVPSPLIQPVIVAFKLTFLLSRPWPLLQ